MAGRELAFDLIVISIASDHADSREYELWAPSLMILLEFTGISTMSRTVA